jgi:hypothetical protein
MRMTKTTDFRRANRVVRLPANSVVEVVKRSCDPKIEFDQRWLTRKPPGATAMPNPEIASSRRPTIATWQQVGGRIAVMRP